MCTSISKCSKKHDTKNLGTLRADDINFYFILGYLNIKLKDLRSFQLCSGTAGALYIGAGVGLRASHETAIEAVLQEHDALVESALTATAQAMWKALENSIFLLVASV